MVIENFELARWISDVLNEPLDTKNLEEALRDGVALCKLMNEIRPGSCRYTVSRQPFMQMENINRFLIAAKSIGVPDHELFQSIDLFEKKNFKQVKICLYAVSRHAQKDKLFPGPFIGPKLSEKKKYKFTEEQLQKAKAFIPMQSGHYVDLGEYVQNMGIRRQITDSILKERKSKKQ